MEKTTPVIDQTLFDLKLNEAQFYSDQGLYDEADIIYVNLINELKQLPQTKSSSIQIRQLEAIRKEYQTETKKNKIIEKCLSDADELDVQADSDPTLRGTELRNGDSSNTDCNNGNIASDIDYKVAKFINQMILDGFRKSASDIHIEPAINSHSTLIRFRIDGICQPYTEIPNKFASHVIFKIKIMAKMDITMRAKPLYGKIRFKNEQTDSIDLQVTTIPTIGSKEDVAIKFFKASIPVDLKALELLQHNFNAFVQMLNKPSGLIIVSGLSNSGITTTLHSALNLINRPEKKIWSVENQVEITHKSIRQTEVQPEKGLDYPELLKAFMRSDSDVIMAGEMTNYGTASILIRASLIGKLTFAGVNAATVSDTVRKMLEMGINPIHFADSLLCILNQRLIRRLCEKCKLPYLKKCTQPYENTIDLIIKEFAKIGDSLGLLSQIDKENITLYEHSPYGCEHCDYSGYKGRVAIHELIINSDSIKMLIKATTVSDNAFIEKTENGFQDRKNAFEKIDDAVKILESSAARHGIYTLKQDAILKVIAGITDISEIKHNYL
ncbi:MAG: Flp pilus assembly complex ATPase component TadA [Desulfamplus sp.]|nr:Flp pilus assembly complex ATPase component TadA [Desulfamplus sp.]